MGPPRNLAPLWEAGGVLLALIALFKALHLAGGIGRTVLEIVAPFLWIYVPVAILHRQRRDLAAYGVTLRGWRQGVRLALAVCAVVLPLYVAGCYAFLGEVLGLRIRPHASLAVAGDALVRLLTIALPEEVFFRGYLQPRLNDLFVRRVRVLGTPVSLSLVVTSALFALGHLVIHPQPARLLVFFPSLLFGWLRERTGSIVAPTLFHGAANATVLVLFG